jgi:periplasmic divalent cation tolerance protein
MAGKILVFYIPCADEAQARALGEAMLGQRLAACYNLFPIQSGYWWQGVVVQEGEWVCLLKTGLAQETALETAIAAWHPYETPCIMRLEMRANDGYAAWIAEETAGGV